MKMLNIKNKWQNMVKKCIFYVVFSYLVASWGVNGVINPVHYYRNFAVQEQQLEASLDDTGLLVKWNQVDGGFKYLSFEVMDAKNFYNDILVNLYSGDELLECVSVEVYKGLNSLEIQENTTSISITSDVIQKNQLIMSGFTISEYKKVDTWKMTEVVFSMLFLIVIWECIQYIKKRYAK